MTTINFHCRSQGAFVLCALKREVSRFRIFKKKKENVNFLASCEGGDTVLGLPNQLSNPLSDKKGNQLGKYRRKEGFFFFFPKGAFLKLTWEVSKATVRATFCEAAAEIEKG